MPRTVATEDVIAPQLGKVAIKIDGKRLPEIDRRATCPEHDIESRTFVGANQYGWVFRCAGLTEKKAKKRLEDKEPLFSGIPAKEATPTAFHYFVAQPPANHRAKSRTPPNRPATPISAPD